MNVFMLLYNILCFPGRVIEKMKKYCIKQMLRECGKNVVLGSKLIIAGMHNISIGDGTAIGPNCVFYASLAELNIGRNVLISPNVTMMTGEHRTDIIGEYMRNVGEDRKLPENDKPIIIEDDVWIGSNVTILKGVTIGRGSIIHAGSVVSKKVKPYTIYINEKMKINRFSDEQIQEHEKILKEKYGVTYPEYHPKNNSFFS